LESEYARFDIQAAFGWIPGRDSAKTSEWRSDGWTGGKRLA